MKNKTAAPQLRFAEFQNTEGWAYMNGDKVFDSISNKDHSSDLPVLAITQEHGAIPRSDIDYNVFVTDKSVESYKVVEVGDFIISLRSFQGGIEYSNYKGICSPAYIILQKKMDVVDVFYKHYFKTVLFIQDLNKNLEGLRDGKMVSYKQFSEILLPNPSVKEQQKIADCLTSLDNLITAENHKLAALKAHKKGLMQQLFPAEGENVPQLRFKEFQNTEGWEEKTLGEFIEQYSERVSSKTELPIYSSTREGLMSQKDYYNNRELINDGEYGVVPKGYFVYRHMSDDATFKFNINEILDKIVVSKEYPIFKTTNLNSHFLLYKLNGGVDFEQFAAEQRKGGTRTRLYFKTLCSWKTLMPSLAEQQKIADCLTSVDALITGQNERLAALKVHKQGLLQQLFPNTTEI
jgi:type I restriction enzyme, S subunit